MPLMPLVALDSADGVVCQVGCWELRRDDSDITKQFPGHSIFAKQFIIYQNSCCTVLPRIGMTGLIVVTAVGTALPAEKDTSRSSPW